MNFENIKIGFLCLKINIDGIGYQNPMRCCKENQIEKELLEELKSSLPSIAEIERELFEKNEGAFGVLKNDYEFQ